MSLSSKLAQAETLLRAHFKALGAEDKTDEILSNIKNGGGTSEANLEEMTVPDLERAGVPVLLARKIVRALGGNVDGAGDSRQVVIVNDDPVNLAARLKPEELVAEYDPNDPTNPFGERLNELTKGNVFLVFTDKASVNVPVSQKLVRELLDGFKPRTSIVVDGELQETYAVGERPARYADENPFVQGTMLRPDGVSDANVEWGSLDMNVRQLIYLAVKGGEIVNTKLEADVFDDVVGKKFEQVARRYPKAAIEFKKLDGAQALPPLKLILSPKVKAAK